MEVPTDLAQHRMDTIGCIDGSGEMQMEGGEARAERPVRQIQNLLTLTRHLVHLPPLPLGKTVSPSDDDDSDELRRAIWLCCGYLHSTRMDGGWI